MKVYQTLSDYEIKHRFFCLTADNASNNVTMAKHLSTLLSNDDIVWDHKTNYIPCFAHIINLVVQKFVRTMFTDRADEDSAADNDDVLEVSLDVHTTVASRRILSKIRDIAKSIRGSSRRWELFAKACKSCEMNPTMIPLDVAVRWNSTFRMLQHAIYLKRPIRRYIHDVPGYDDLVLSEAEWLQAEVMLIFLLPFQRCTSRFECNDTNPEVDFVFFAYDSLYNHIEDVKEKLGATTSKLGALPCAGPMREAIEAMEGI